MTAAELAEAKNKILAAALRERETFDGRAFAIGEALVRTGDPRALDRRLALVGKVTAADVMRVARRYLQPETRIDIHYLDEKQRASGAADGWQNPTPMPTWAFRSNGIATSRGLGLTIAGLIQQRMPAAQAAGLTTQVGAVTPTGATAVAKLAVAAASASIVVVGDARLFVDRLRAIKPDLELIRADAIDMASPTLVASVLSARR